MTIWSDKMKKYKLYNEIITINNNYWEIKGAPDEKIKKYINKACGEELLMRQCAWDFIQWARNRWIDKAGRMVFFEETASKTTPSGYIAFSNYGGGGWLFEKCYFCKYPVYEFLLNYKQPDGKDCKYFFSRKNWTFDAHRWELLNYVGQSKYCFKLKM